MGLHWVRNPRCDFEIVTECRHGEIADIKQVYLSGMASKYSRIGRENFVSREGNIPPSELDEIDESESSLATKYLTFSSPNYPPDPLRESLFQISGLQNEKLQNEV